MTRRTGKIGEIYFAGLVANYSEGATCNPSLEDNKGWDHVVEFDHHPMPNVPADLQSKIPPIFVQTKTQKDKANLSIKLKLGNALTFTRTTNPCFVILVISPPGGPITTYLRHWWADEMGRTLKRARRLSAEGVDEEAFNRRSMTFTMGPYSEIPSSELVKRLKDLTLGSGPDYAAAKRQLRETLGFGPDRFHGNIKIGPIASIDEILDHQLGLTKSIPVSKIDFADRRFGIDVPLPMPRGKVTFASIKAIPTTTCQVRARGPDGIVLNLAGDIISASLPLAEGVVSRVRIRTPVLDFIWDESSRLSLKGRLEGAVRRPLAELAKMVRFLSWAGKGSIDITVFVDNQRILGAEARIDPSGEEKTFEVLAEELETLERLAQDATASPILSLDDVAQSVSVPSLHGALAAEGLTLRAELAGPIPSEIEEVVSQASAIAGEWEFSALVSMQVISREDPPGQLVLNLDRPRVLTSYAHKVSSEEARALVRADHAREAARPAVLCMPSFLKQMTLISAS